MNRLAFLLLVLLSATALACPVCGTAATEEGQEAYKFMSIIMSALPLLAIGGVVSWVALRMRAHARAEALEVASPTPHPVSRFAPQGSNQA